MERLRLVAAGLIMLWGFSPAEAQQVRDHYYSVSIKDVEDSVARALEAEDAGEKVAVTIIGQRNNPIYAQDSPMTLEVKTLRIDKPATKWSANVLIQSGDKVITAMPFSGRYEQLIEVPVLQHKLLSGEVIREEDLGTTELTESRVRGETVMTKADLVGKEVRRVISPGRPVRKDEVRFPEVIKKGDTVEMHYHSSTMDIKATGEALEGGSMGDTIRIRNDGSKVTVRGTITGPGEISVGGN